MSQKTKKNLDSISPTPSAWRNRLIGSGMVDAKELLANPKNWRIHPEAQKQALGEVLDTVGWVQNVVVNKSTGFVVDGHLRAALAVSRQERVPVLWVELSPAEEALVLATMDPLGAMAQADEAKLNALIEEVLASEIGEDLGGGIEDLFADISAEYAGETPVPTEDEVPEVPATPVSLAGDLWRLGPHLVLCGDSTSMEATSRLFAAAPAGSKPVVMVTDPPFGVRYDPSWRADAGINRNKFKMGQVVNDDRSDWREAWAHFPGDVVYVWHAGKHASTVQQSIEACGFEIRSQIIWGKDRFALSRGDYHWAHEPCWYAVRGHAHWNGDRSQSTLWQIKARDDAGHGHGTQKPVEAMRRPILNNTERGECVYDPFLGSGTTLIAAELTGRICLGLELEPKYVDVIVNRWQAQTGRQAILDGTGRTFAEVAVERRSTPVGV